MYVLRHNDVRNPPNAQLGPRVVDPICEYLFDGIVAEELQPAIAGDRQEMNVPVLIVSTELTRHCSSLTERASVPHPSPRAKDGEPARRRDRFSSHAYTYRSARDTTSVSVISAARTAIVCAAMATPRLCGIRR